MIDRAQIIAVLALAFGGFAFFYRPRATDGPALMQNNDDDLQEIAVTSTHKVDPPPLSTSGARGIRNNNPGNIRRGDQWLGMRSTQTDPDFVQFTAPLYGIRAMARVLKNYQARHGIDTLRGIIERWAPHTENATLAYIQFVGARTGLRPDVTITVEAELVKIIPAIIEFENGEQPYSNMLILQGVGLA